MIITYSNGYKIEHKSEILDEKKLNESFEGITKLHLMQDGTIIAEKDFIRCPQCNSLVPTYEFNLNKKYTNLGIIKEKQRIQQFINTVHKKISNNPQISFDNLTIENNISIEEPLEPSDTFICPHCRKKSTQANKNDIKKVEITKDDQYLIFKRQINGVVELLNVLEELSVNSLDVDLSAKYYECLKINLNTGNTAIMMFKNDIPIDSHNVDDTVLENITPLIIESFAVKEFIIRTLCPDVHHITWQTAAYFNLKQIPLMFKYKGFNYSFFFALPYNLNTGEMDESFNEILSHCLNYRDAIAYLNGMEFFPKGKEIRKLLYQNQALFLYAEQIARLNKLLGEVHLCEIIVNSSNLLFNLAALKSYPLLFSFFDDFTSDTFRKSKLTKMLIKNFSCVLMYASNYVIMSNRLKSQEKTNCWKCLDKHIDNLWYHATPFKLFHSLPMEINNEERIMEGVYNGYNMIRLKNTYDCRIAGNALRNCLRDWACNNNKVFVVEKNNNILAAVEVNNHREEIIQAYLKNNNPITNEPEIYKAIRKFADENELNWDCDDDIEENEVDILELFQGNEAI